MPNPLKTLEVNDATLSLCNDRQIWQTRCQNDFMEKFFFFFFFTTFLVQLGKPSIHPVNVSNHD